LNYFTNFTQTKNIINKLNNKKSAGFDGIPNIVLKKLPEKIKWYCTILFNNALNNMYFPEKMEKSENNSHTKKGQRQLRTNKLSAYKSTT
jgi:hypothetical protein